MTTPCLYREVSTRPVQTIPCPRHLLFAVAWAAAGVWFLLILAAVVAWLEGGA